MVAVKEIQPLPQGLVEALAARPGTEHVQTHLSHVFLTADRVFKLRKAVNLGFVDFGTCAARNADCEREVSLNRRLAPDVYLGIAPLRTAGSGFEWGEVADKLDPDPRVEHCVVMRRLLAGRDALTLLEQGRLETNHLDAVAARVARFHGEHGLGTPAPFSRDQWWQRCTGPLEETLSALASQPGAVDADAVAAVSQAARRVASERTEAFERRRRDGRAVDGHGDLHLQHVWFETPDPILIDCLEFRDDLRHIDASADVAFLAMDLRYRGREDWAERFLRQVARDSDDFDSYRVVDYFESYRAAVRAKVAAIASNDSEVGAAQRERSAESARRHLALARQALKSRSQGAVILVAGVVGVGKTSAAQVIADALHGVLVSSDRVRKRLVGLAPTDRAAARLDAGLYAPHQVDKVYSALLQRATPVVDSGRAVILDATFSRADHRAAARGMASMQGLPFRVVEVRCSPEVARRRLAARAERGEDPSDAGPELHATSIRRFEPISGLPPGEHVLVDTDRDGWREKLAEISIGWKAS